MPLTFDNDIVRVTAAMSLSGVSAIQNVYHLRLNGTAMEASTLHPLLCAWIETIYTEILANFPITVTFVGINSYNVTREEPIGLTDFPTIVMGTGAGDANAPQLCGLVLFGTLTGRSQGRKFFGPFAEFVHTSNGGVLAGAVAEMALAGAAALVDITNPPDSILSAGNYRYPDPEHVPPITARFVPWVSCVAQNQFYTQRRRRMGVGI